MDDYVRRILCAGAKVEHGKNLRETHRMRNEFYLIIKAVFDRPSLPPCFLDTGGIPLLSQLDG